MDISSMDVARAAEAGAEIELYHPGSNEPLGIFISVIGEDAEEFQRLQVRYQREALARLQRTIGGRKPSTDDEDVSTRQEIEICVACTTGWRGMGENGVEVPFTREAARRIYATPGYRWIREQVRAALRDRELFFKRSASSS